MLSVEIVQLKGDVPRDIEGMLAESERAGHRLVRRLIEDWADGSNRFAGEGEAIFVASIEGKLIGICGLNVDPYANDPTIGRVRHLYVLEAWRHRGVGKKLVERLLAAAKSRFRQVRLRTYSGEAAAFYERIGFLSVEETAATHLRNLHGAAPAA